MGIFDKAKDLATEHSDQVSEGIEKVGDLIDEKTGSKYADQVDQAKQAAKDFIGKGDQPADGG